MRESLARLDAELEEFFILSDLKITEGDDHAEGRTTATLQPTKYARCERCWRHRSTVGTIAEHPTLCDRCADAVSTR